MNIRLNIDTQEFKAKPEPFPASLRARLCREDSIREVTPEQLISAVQRGRSFTPAVMTGTAGANWAGQQVICADIDNDTGSKDAAGNKIMLGNPLIPDEARAIMAKYGIDPYFMYYTFSNSEIWPKYRIVLVLDEALTDAAEAENLGARFTGIFNAARAQSADTGAGQNARQFYGGGSDCVFYTSGKTTAAATLRTLPELPATDAEQGKRYRAQPAGQQGTQERVKAAIESFDLAQYIMQNESCRASRNGGKLFFNPCPICKHNDCFNITGNVYHCFSSADGSGGSIIDYLMNREKIDLSAAFDKFKYDIMGYDRDEWKKERPQQHETREAQNTQDAQEEQTASALSLNDGIGSYIAGALKKDIAAFTDASNIKTGFPRFDHYAGGLYPGLYVIGAISSLGKTTYIHQMADQLAAAGKHVLFFSLEMSRLEMATKSISRKTAQIDFSNAITSIDIRRGVTSALTERATMEYIESVGDRMNIIEGGFNTNVSFIAEYTRQYIARHNARPVVIVDYLQIMQAAQKNTVREAIDYNVVELKRLTRALEVPVIVISSVNRGNYLLPVDYESFKESGGIEYTCDVVLGMQLSCLDEEIFEKDNKIKIKRERIKQAKGANPREIKLVCLKNRYGRPDWTIDYKYYTRYDLFVEKDGLTPTDEKTPWN